MGIVSLLITQIPIGPREFDIDINKQAKLRRMLETSAHEMVPAKQFARGELYESPKNKQASVGKADGYPQRTRILGSNPEIEAHGRECGLFIPMGTGK